MKYASKIGAVRSLVIGGDELESKRAVIKNMESGERAECALSAEDIAKECSR